MASLVTGAQPQAILTTQAGPRGTAHEVVSGTSADMGNTVADLESFFGPIAREVRDDPDRFQRISRRHLTSLPYPLRGQQFYVQDRIDGLITDASMSPFTSLILPYMFHSAPDEWIKWYVNSFDEGMASRVPYEATGRTLQQSQEKFKTLLKRMGMNISMEHNFLASEAGRSNLYHQMQQLVGSIQKTNDMQVHVALIRARSYFRKVMRLRPAARFAP